MMGRNKKTQQVSQLGRTAASLFLLQRADCLP